MDFLIQLDAQIFLSINYLQNSFLNILVLGINWVTEGAFLWLLICFLIFIYDKKDRKRKIILILTTLLLNSWIVNVPFKFFIFRLRPYEVLEGVRVLGKTWVNSSFPSGHVAASVGVLLILFYLFKIRQKWLIFFSVLFILLLGFARIYVGMHYPTDILVGIVVGLFSALLVIWLDKQVRFLEGRDKPG